MYDTRSKIGKVVLTHINTRIKGLRADEIKALVQRALSEDGELYYGDTIQKVFGTLTVY